MTMRLLTNIGRLVTMAGEHAPRRGAAFSELGAIENAAVLFDGGKIVAAGPASEVSPRPRAEHAKRIDARGGCVIPGFCDSHTHPVFARTRQDEYEKKDPRRDVSGHRRGGRRHPFLRAGAARDG
ncbi:MAG: hypothetical protein M5R36_11135 [Deltaproteobacteria bacterium]|nr:hypothetical protein [Deltaproteobacteria bacterium]